MKTAKVVERKEGTWWKKKEKRHRTEERSSLVIVKRDAQVDAG